MPSRYGAAFAARTLAAIALCVFLMLNIHGAVAASGATDLGVVNDRWIDASSLKNFGESSARLLNAVTEEEKAIAAFRMINQATFYSAGNAERSEPAYTRYFVNPLKILNVHTDHHCDGLSRLLEMVWRSMGGQAEKAYQSGHTRAELFYRDNDGVERWHFFDTSAGWFAKDRSGAHVASADEIILQNALLYNPSVLPVRRNPLPIMPGYTHETHLDLNYALENYTNHFSLRKNESVTILWSNIGKPYWIPTDRGGGQFDLEHGPYEKTYGNSTWRYTPDFSDNSYKDGLYVPQVNISSVSDDGMNPKIHPSWPGSTGSLVYFFSFPYIVSDAWIDANIVRNNSGDSVRIYISNNGSTWKQVWNATSTGNITISAANISEQFDVTGGYPSGLITPFGHYTYFVKVEMSGAQSISDVGINGLSFTTVTQHNIFSLPQLWPVSNNVTVSGAVLPNTSLKLTYTWRDLQGSDRRNVTIVENPPYTYNIQADGTRWADVISKSLVIEALPRLGGGNRTIEKEAVAANTRNITLAEEFPTSRLIGTEPAPQLKTPAEYILDIEDGLANISRCSKIDTALLALQVLRAPESEQAIRDVIYHNPNCDSITKVWALQALYLVAGERSVPVMVDVLNNDPRIGWTDHTGSRTDGWVQTMSVSTAAFVLADIGSSEAKSAAPRIAQLVTEWKGSEHQWGLIKDLGILGSSENVPGLVSQLDYSESTYNALWALGNIGDPSAVNPILAVLTSEDTHLFDPGNSSRHSINAIEALGKIGSQDLAPRLYKYLDHADEEVRGTTATALGRLGNRDAVPHLEDLIEGEPFEWVREAAQDSIALLAPCTNGQKKNCPKQQGVCAGSQQTCTGGSWPGCSNADYTQHSPEYEQPETTKCSDNLDNDCDGAVDECSDNECVTMAVLMNYIGRWKSGQISMLMLMGKISRWKTGQGC